MGGWVRRNVVTPLLGVMPVGIMLVGVTLVGVMLGRVMFLAITLVAIMLDPPSNVARLALVALLSNNCLPITIVPVDEQSASS
jgi:hypothetical protein